MEGILMELGVSASAFLVALFFSMLWAIFRIIEPDTPPTSKKIAMTFIVAISVGFLVPGLMKYYWEIDNIFVIGLSAIVAMLCFEMVIIRVRKYISDKIN